MSKFLDGMLDAIHRFKTKHGEPVIGIAMTAESFQDLKRDCFALPSFPQTRLAVTAVMGLQIFIKESGPAEPLYATPSDDEER